MLYAIIAVVVVVVAVVGLAFAGVIPLFHSSSSGKSSSSGATDLTYSQAAAQTNPVASAYAGGPWTLFFAQGIDSQTGYTGTFNSTVNVSAGCTAKLVGPTSGTIAAYTGTITAGVAPFWDFVYGNTDDSSFLLVSDISGSPTVLATYSGSSCWGDYKFSAIPSDALDSPAAASDAAATTNVSTFLSSHSSLNAYMQVFSGISSVEAGAPLWVMIYSTCSIGSGVSGSSAEAAMNAVSGAVFFSISLGTFLCGGSGSGSGSGGGHGTLSADLALAYQASGSTSGIGDYTNVTVSSATGGIEYGDLSIAVAKSLGDNYTVKSTWYAQVSVSGLPVAVYEMSSGTWELGGSTAIASGATIQIYTGTTDPAGGVVVFYGNASYTGLLTVSIPT